MFKKYRMILRICAFMLSASLLLFGIGTDTYAKTNAKKENKSDQSTECSYKNKEKIYLDKNWKYADHAKITSGYAVFYKAKKNRKNIIVGINAGHGTSNVGSKKTLYRHAQDGENSQEKAACRRI